MSDRTIDQDIKFYVAMAEADMDWLRRWKPSNEEDEQRIRKRQNAALAVVQALIAYKMILNNSRERDNAQAV